MFNLSDSDIMVKVSRNKKKKQENERVIKNNLRRVKLDFKGY